MVAARQFGPRVKATMTATQHRKRPARIMNTRTKSVIASPTARANATNSRFLSLPPEVRNRIYGFVLGGGTIHVGCTMPNNRGYAKWTLDCCVCRADNSDREAARLIRNLDADVELENYYQRHRKCNMYGEGPKARLSLSLLATCSQIHREAALVPFQENVFAVKDYALRRASLRGFIPIQIRSIKSLCTEDSHATVPLHILRWFSGLAELISFKEVHPDHQEPFLASNITPVQETLWLNDPYAQSWMRRKASPLTSVTVCAYYYDHSPRRSSTRAAPKQFGTYCRMWERRLLNTAPDEPDTVAEQGSKLDTQ